MMEMDQSALRLDINTIRLERLVDSFHALVEQQTEIANTVSCEVTESRSRVDPLYDGLVEFVFNCRPA